MLIKKSVKTNKHILIRDSREQRPLEFSYIHFKTIIKKLNYGDYRVRFLNGNISKTVFERKSIPDLFGSLTTGYNRFAKEIARAKAEHIKFILIVEGNLTKIYKGYRHSKIQGKSIVKTAFSIWVRHGVIPAFVKNREEAAEFITQYYLAEWRKIQEGKYAKS